MHCGLLSHEPENNITQYMKLNRNFKSRSDNAEHIYIKTNKSAQILKIARYKRSSVKIIEIISFQVFLYFYFML